MFIIGGKYVHTNALMNLDKILFNINCCLSFLWVHPHTIVKPCVSVLCQVDIIM